MTVNPRNGRNERIFVNLEAVYPTPEQAGTELSFEELRASHRGWLNKAWSPEETDDRPDNKDVESLDKTEETTISIGSATREVVEKIIVHADQVMLDENGMAKNIAPEVKGRRMKIKEVNETQISE